MGIFNFFEGGGGCIVRVLNDSKLMQYSPQQTQRYANQAKCIAIHTSMLAHVVQWVIAAYFIQPLSLLGEKKNPEELIWKSRKYHSLIFSNSNPPWLVIPRTAPPLRFLPLPPVPPHPRWDTMEEQTSTPPHPHPHHHLPLHRRRIPHAFSPSEG